MLLAQLRTNHFDITGVDCNYYSVLPDWRLSIMPKELTNNARIMLDSAYIMPVCITVTTSLL